MVGFIKFGIAFVPDMEYNDYRILEVMFMVSFMTANEAAEKWNISRRRVVTLCKENRIADVAMLGNMWIIPKDAEKPEDARSVRRFEVNNDVKPFLKWAGGKGQLIKELKKYYPFGDDVIYKYAEPMVGGGAVLFDILSKFDVKEVFISDTNKELMNTYRVIRDEVNYLLPILTEMQNEFIQLDEEARKEYYYDKRECFNRLKDNGDFGVDLAALMIFLNKTCFNGLYRVNKKGQFNVPMGSYKNPLICDEKNLKLVSEKLYEVEMACGDYKDSAEFIDKHTFIYFDPPYRPLTKTSGFTSYTEEVFDDKKQIELADFIKEMSKKGAKVLISNSDPKNVDNADNFFDELYSEFNITRVEATRMINSNSKSRGRIKELLISNF